MSQPFFSCVRPTLQAAGEHQPTERRHWATEEAAGQKETPKPRVSLPLHGFHVGTQAAQNQGGQWQRLGPLPQALPASAVSKQK